VAVMAQEQAPPPRRATPAVSSTGSTMRASKPRRASSAAPASAKNGGPSSEAHPRPPRPALPHDSPEIRCAAVGAGRNNLRSCGARQPPGWGEREAFRRSELDRKPTCRARAKATMAEVLHGVSPCALPSGGPGRPASEAAAALLLHLAGAWAWTGAGGCSSSNAALGGGAAPAERADFFSRLKDNQDPESVWNGCSEQPVPCRRR